MGEASPMYIFTRGERCIFAEIYFPYRAAYQGAIFDALRYGRDAKRVRGYMNTELLSILRELQAYPNLFDPYRYRKRRPRTHETEIELAQKRIGLYRSPFSGSSLYPVNGVFINNRGRVYEEATQVVRIMFRKESRFIKTAEDADCGDVLRAIRYWAINEAGTLIEHVPWGDDEKARFIDRHQPISLPKLTFTENFFEPIVKEAIKWIDDCALFVFGYLVRIFSENVLKERLTEEEIWVTSFFDLNVNRVRRT